MLSEILEVIGPMPVILGILLFLVAAVKHSSLFSQSSKPGRFTPVAEARQLPHSIPSKIPYVGHMMGYVRDGHSYFSSLCGKTSQPVFTICMAKVKLSLVKPELARDLPKVRHLSLGPLVLQLFRRSLNLGEFSCSLLKEEDEMSRKFAPEISRLFREEFIPNRNLRKYVEEIDVYVHREIMALEGLQTIHLEDWIFKTLVGALGKSLWGGDDGPFGAPEFVAHLRMFLMNMKQLNAPATFMIDKKLLASRSFVRERLEHFSFEKYTEKCEAGTGAIEETFLGRVQALCLEHGAAAEGWTDYQLLLIAGLSPNVMAASTWMFHHLLADPELMTQVRDEVGDCVKKSNGSIDLADMSDSCPLLSATWLEVLRFHGGFSLGRYVHEDTDLASKYLLKKGSYVLAPLRPHHFDRQSWGFAVDEFIPGRFLKANGTLDEIQRRKLRVYGVFGTLCPGRYLAVHMAMALTVRLLLAFHMAPLNASYVPPGESKDTVAGLATPEFDVEVSITKRETSYDGLKIRFKSSRQTF
ncbi:NADPH-cytochrome P450 reductase [Hyphodiscus hymeniophilus]|uniref:NADPH-cytochrome P450 reductase n=1 Tax=Hyphodiscus hymeniophilus TaxID=353542 RepID=A0A9P6VEV0_9HELO|nr:NADPH-cytochrome P450 reductase [Hyphodiscus hymeniophilus]